MHIGGLLKYSLIDYPPNISSVIFTAGCNFRCPYCHNPELVTIGPDTRHLGQESVIEFLFSRRKYLDGVVISGGEPTLQPDLAEFCEEIKKMGFLVKIDTNGTKPRVIRQLICKGLVDYLAMDVKTEPDRYSPWISDQIDAGAIRSSARLIIESGLPHEFRTTCVAPFIDEAAVRGIAGLISGADLHAFQHVQNGKVLDPDFFAGRQRFLSDRDLQKFQAVMAGSVKKAIIR